VCGIFVFIAVLFHRCKTNESYTIEPRTTDTMFKNHCLVIENFRRFSNINGHCKYKAHAAPIRRI